MDFSVDGVNYSSDDMDAFTQADILSLISPLVAAGGAELLPWLREMREAAIARGPGSLLDLNPEGALGHFGALTRELAKMKPEDRRAVFIACLRLVKKEVSPGKFTPIWIEAAGRSAEPALMNDLFLMMKIVGRVLQGTYSRFFSASP